MRPSASPLVEIGIPVLAILVVALFIAGCARAARDRLVGVTLGVAVWLAFTGGLAASGLLARFDLRPPRTRRLRIKCSLGCALRWPARRRSAA